MASIQALKYLFSFEGGWGVLPYLGRKSLEPYHSLPKSLFSYALILTPDTGNTQGTSRQGWFQLVDAKVGPPNEVPGMSLGLDAIQ